MDFEKLMAQAMAVTQQQDAALAERARRKLKEDDERRMREAKAERERQRLQEEQRKKNEQNKQQQLKDKKKRKGPSMGDSKRNSKLSTSTTKRSSSKSNAMAALAQLQPAKKKDMSFEELMAQANRLPTKRLDSTPKGPLFTKKEERPNVSGKRPPTALSSSSTPSHTPRNSSTSNNNHNNTPNIYQKRRPTTMSKSTMDHSSSSMAPSSNMSARDKVRQMMRQPPQKLNTQKRDLRSISEMQREIRHKKGIYSDEEEDTRADPRLLHNKQRAASEYRYNGRVSPGPPPSSRPQYPAGKRPAGSAISSRDRGGPPAAGGARRMPFMRPPPERRRPMQRYEEEEEIDEEMDDFVVDDEEEEDDYSAEIGRIFRYNKKRYRNETYSDDDMEADAREVLREEKRRFVLIFNI
ncbi:hypothetical protein BDA99DRAFT_505203 [Phascolomyces articulosus]|uniref:SPT2 n=1 Tax=Phascolomyces articulosus TaxID=60185 RepID=A0AAD5PHJ0_9FUNG|nr:hypothetical protein BDA99DRAFT_505203 [Phascolomyces articulosus]